MHSLVLIYNAIKLTQPRTQIKVDLGSTSFLSICLFQTSPVLAGGDIASTMRITEKYFTQVSEIDVLSNFIRIFLHFRNAKKVRLWWEKNISNILLGSSDSLASDRMIKQCLCFLGKQRMSSNLLFPLPCYSGRILSFGNCISYIQPH